MEHRRQNGRKGALCVENDFATGSKVQFRNSGPCRRRPYQHRSARAAGAALSCFRGFQPVPQSRSRHISFVTSRRSCATKCVGCQQAGRRQRHSPCSAFEMLDRGAPDCSRHQHTKLMPPWKPEPGHGDFAGVRRLSEGQVAGFSAVGRGRRALEGDPVGADVGRGGEAKMGTRTPDIVVTMPEPYILPAEGADTFARSSSRSPGRTKPVRHRSSVQSWQRASRPSREHQDRSERIIAATRCRKTQGPGSMEAAATRGFRTAIFWAGRPANGRARRRAMPGNSRPAPTSSSNCT